MCSLELRAPRKGFGMSFLIFTEGDPERGKVEAVRKMVGQKPRGVCSRDGVRASAKTEYCSCTTTVVQVVG